MSGPKAPVLILTDAERVELARLVRRAHGSQALATRARIVSACDNRRPGRDYEIREVNSEAMLLIAASKLMIKRLAKRPF